MLTRLNASLILSVGLFLLRSKFNVEFSKYAAPTGISKDEFVTTTYQYLRDGFKESLYPNIMSDLKKMAQTGYTSTLGDIFMPEDFDDFVTLDDDRFIISYVEMCNDFNDITDNKYENSADPDWFKETILRNMQSFSGLNIQDTGEELIFNDYE